MESYNYLNKGSDKKDNTKGHKIAAAVYLVSHHLSDSDPLKNTLRTHAVTLSIAHQESVIAALAQTIETLLQTAVMARMISEKNASIISLELRHYVTSAKEETTTLSALFASDSAPDSTTQNLSYNTSRPPYPARPLKISNPSKVLISHDNKSKRQDTILSFINERKSVGIKDIAALFSDTSEKTIQRELGALVSSGKITKRGEKRWSIYLSVSEGRSIQ
ncbi:MAG: seg [Candidatus Nomurabacteria bacterium]|nr:seg [Candidatus Nomurabacteria bacterium]